MSFYLLTQVVCWHLASSSSPSESLRGPSSPDKKWPCAGQAVPTRTAAELENEFLMPGLDTCVFVPLWKYSFIIAPTIHHPPTPSWSPNSVAPATTKSKLGPICSSSKYQYHIQCICTYCRWKSKKRTKKKKQGKCASHPNIQKLSDMKTWKWAIHPPHSPCLKMSPNFFWFD